MHCTIRGRTVETFLVDNRKVFAINSCGDGCQDLNCSRMPNMLLFLDVAKVLMTKYNLVYVNFGQYAPDDSPLNRIERLWASEAKKLGGLLCSVHADGDKAPPHALSGSQEEKSRKMREVLKRGMKQILGRLESTPSLKGIEATYESVELGSEKDLHDKYDGVTRFFYSSLKNIRTDPSMQEMMREYRILCAHADRRRLTFAIVTHIPHLLQPEVFGPAEDCSLCSHVTVSPSAQRFLDTIIANGGKMFSPSKAEASASYRTCLEEMQRLQLNLPGSKPDELLPVNEVAFGRK